MSERLILQSMLGTVVSISANLPTTYDSAGYTATGVVTFTPCGKVESYGEHGATAQTTNFTPVDTGVTETFKGATDYGTKSFVFGYLPSDAGQDIIEAAVASKNRYSVKIAYPAGTGETTGEVHYLDVLVTKRVFQDGDVSATRKISVDFKICRAPVIVAGS